MTNKSLTTRLVQELLAAIKKFIRLRDRLRVKTPTKTTIANWLSVETEEMFKPIKRATKDMIVATERAIFGDITEEERKKKTPLLGVLEKIAAETEEKKHSKGYKNNPVVLKPNEKLNSYVILMFLHQRNLNKEK